MKQWHKDLLNNEWDGLSSMLDLFDREEEFLNHFFQHTYFFEKKDVEAQAKHLSDQISQAIAGGERVPVRFSMKSFEKFHFANQSNQKGISRTSFKNRQTAVDFSEKTDLFHSETNIRVKIDKDGNYFVRDEIAKFTGYRVSQGAISDIKNFVISHIWGKTDNPYYFTSLWNITLIPNHLSFILDKPNGSSDLITKIKLIAKAICFKLYSPADLHIGNKALFSSDEIADISPYFEFADEFIKSDKIHFLKHRDSVSASVQVDVFDMQADLLSVIEKNSDFVFKALNYIASFDIQFVDYFKNGVKTKEICKLAFPILYEITGLKPEEIEAPKQRYYANTFQFKDREFWVCNHWYPTNKEMLLDWIVGSK